jgi:glycosyltransferase involved in cell wall biosynthesis
MVLKKIKVVHIIKGFGIGGTENVVVDLCNKTDSQKFELHLLCLSNNKLDMIKNLNQNVTIHMLPIDHDKVITLKGLVKMSKSLKQEIISINPDIIHSHFSSSILIFIEAIMYRLISTTAIHISTIHNAGFHYQKARNIKDIIKLFLEKISVWLGNYNLISISQTVHNNNIKHFKHFAKNIKLIYNGINANKYNKNNYSYASKEQFKVPNDKILISYVARLDYYKNHEYLIDIWHDIISEVPNVVMCFAGDGETREHLQSKINQKGYASSIILLGNIDNVPELLSVTDIGVFPSIFEGFGLSLLEMFAMGIPIVASDITAFKEIVSDTKCAMLISLEDRREYIDSILNLCTNQKLRANGS